MHNNLLILENNFMIGVMRKSQIYRNITVPTNYSRYGSINRNIVTEDITNGFWTFDDPYNVLQLQACRVAKVRRAIV